MEEKKIIRNDSDEDKDAMEAFDMAVGITPKTDVWVCMVCGYMYNPELGDAHAGIPAGTSFEDLPADWVCPWCSAGKDAFEPKVEVSAAGSEEAWTNS